ncbi:MAG: YfaP family protein [Bacteroidales bacterium]
MKFLRLTIALASFCLFSTHFAAAQFEQMKQKMDDVLKEVEEDVFTLRFFDAVTGDPVKNANISIESIGKYETDNEGKITFPRQPDGILNVQFEKEDYIPALFEVEVIAETMFFNRFSVSPVLNIEQFRVVLDWDKAPNDLDAHFIKKRSYHISYRNTRVLSDGTGQLDRDEMQGYGPETITVEQIDSDSEYIYNVHNYSQKMNSRATTLSRSKATVRVYGNNELLRTYTVPSTHRGETWNVFKIVDGQVVDY